MTFLQSGIKVGQRQGLSEIDVEKVALIYSNECVSRNKEYLLQTCPSVVKSVTKPIDIKQKDIDDYFKERLWAFGIINFKLRDKMEFSKFQALVACIVVLMLLALKTIKTIILSIIGS